MIFLKIMLINRTDEHNLNFFQLFNIHYHLFRPAWPLSSITKHTKFKEGYLQHSVT